MDRVPFSRSSESVLPVDLRRSKRKLCADEHADDSYFCSSAKRVLTEEAMAASLQELHLAAPPPAAVVTTTVTLCPLYTPVSSSIAWPTQSAMTLNPSDSRFPVICGADSAVTYNGCPQREIMLSDEGNDAQYGKSEGKASLWQNFKSLEEDSDDDTESPKMWLSSELTRTLESNGSILPSAVFNEIAQHSNREGWELERVPPVSREITGTELVPWVRPERIIEQSFLKSIQEKDHNSDEEKEDIKSVQARDGFCRPLEGDYGEDHDNEEQMET